MADRASEPAGGPAYGPAYDFWLRVERERTRRNWSQEELSGRTGIPPSTINRLKTGATRTKTVNALADALGIDRVAAAQLAGLIPRSPKPDVGGGRPRVTVREAIMTDPDLTDTERNALISVHDAIKAAHRAAGRAPAATAGERSEVFSRTDDSEQAM